MKQYNLLEFDYGYTGRFYQVINFDTSETLNYDLDGNLLYLDPNISYGAHYILIDTEKPSWG
jgi:hypothetical protein